MISRRQQLLESCLPNISHCLVSTLLPDCGSLLPFPILRLLIQDGSFLGEGKLDSVFLVHFYVYCHCSIHDFSPRESSVWRTAWKRPSSSCTWPNGGGGGRGPVSSRILLLLSFSGDPIFRYSLMRVGVVNQQSSNRSCFAPKGYVVTTLSWSFWIHYFAMN